MRRFGSYFTGLKIRTSDDDKSPMITGERKCHNIQPASSNNTNTNIVNRVWTIVMDKVTTAIERIINDDLGSEQEEQEIEQKQAVLTTETETETEAENSEEISVGDYAPSACTRMGVRRRHRVTIDDSPGHWSWVSPFKVEAIEGNWVALNLCFTHKSTNPGYQTNAATSK